MARPLRKGEQIDLFVSHSWHDDAELKWESLVHSVEQFKQSHGRYPTLWIDKICIDQNCIADGLRALPMSVMSCNQMLVLCGNTYAYRLWCVWEMFTLLAFTDLDLALERILLAPLQSNAPMQLGDFEVDRAHCYDPNEESKLRHLIDSLGKGVFGQRVRMLGARLQAVVQRI